ncbi:MULTISPECIES: DUF732 domain-containing protein [unclassified Mycobacterium]|uniref:DUF732 domain-containing protein n=1 Tax=unclassified Mycobacterium TaxID=2642494 RepID=UPI0007FE5E8A|nr:MULTISPECIES: DUF732 domain-containing protein [unclassified Mycobacterium]OBG72042.1 hypothetical protein A5700_00690 [Mycobacterium sp. E1214]OBH24683.1 hypothetical protein A5693_07280 [Mycobacterium sp. E1319]
MVASAAAVLCAAPAAADPTDDSFLSALTNYGIVIGGDNDPIAMARAVCDGLDKNQKASFLALKVKREANLTAKQSGFFVGASVSAYCPQYRDQVDGSLDWLNPGPPLM